jgi:hypothetical protein
MQVLDDDDNIVANGDELLELSHTTSPTIESTGKETKYILNCSFVSFFLRTVHKKFLT